ncbi:MAG: hypothetical protein EZS28_048193 [Streblomastix strix]|uniref:Uncharacterized protein n=1 Tax=Streblomastix strix TaxID=222440 RepID=A0A5J4TF88_9EUKA|nr:MAG: hypothetical protein EZS28_048193 [Streblomastix strix]
MVSRLTKEQLGSLGRLIGFVGMHDLSNETNRRSSSAMIIRRITKDIIRTNDIVVGDACNDNVGRLR